MKTNIRKTLYKWHRWLGAHFALLLFIICVSGSLAVLAHEWDWLIDPAFRAETEQVDWAAIEETIEREFPEHSVSNISAPVADGFAATASLQSSNGQLQLALFEPATGELNGVRHMLTVQVFLRQFHKTLLVPEGIYLVGLFAFLLAFSVVTGLWIYRKWWTRLTRFRLRGSPNMRWSDLHRTTGVWMSLFGLLIAITGIWYLVEAAVHDAGAHIAPEDPSLSASRLSAIDSKRSAKSLGEVVEAARDAYPGLHVRNVRYPNEATAPFRIEGQTDALLVRNRANRVFVDPYDLDIIGVQKAGDLSALQRWQDMADELHFGTLGTSGGLWSKLLYFLLGLGVSFATLAGPILSMQRDRGPRDDTEIERVDWKGRVVAGLTIAIIAGTLLFAYIGYNYPVLKGRQAPIKESTPVDIAGHTATLTAHGDGDHAHYVLRWQDARPVDFAGGQLTFPNGESGKFYGWHHPEAAGPIVDAMQLTVDRHGADPVTTSIELGEVSTYEQLDTVRPSIAAHIFIYGLLAVFVIGSLVWLQKLWLPLARSLVRRS